MWSIQSPLPERDTERARERELNTKSQLILRFPGRNSKPISVWICSVEPADGRFFLCCVSTSSWSDGLLKSLPAHIIMCVIMNGLCAVFPFGRVYQRSVILSIYLLSHLAVYAILDVYSVFVNIRIKLFSIVSWWRMFYLVCGNW